jgi:UDP-N-acetyl-2-amino-2-deoxyglucuronate dehydrogenase
MDFGLIGAAGYVAPRHLSAIKAIGGDLKVAFDITDSVGVLDNYFPAASFFTEFERFDRHMNQLRRKGQKLDYLSICSPNYLHDAHCRFALRSDSNAICEKPLVLNPWNLDDLTKIQTATGRGISTILQLRLHPAIQNLKTRTDARRDKEHNVDLTYIVARGRWYQTSWKGNEVKSGGVATNIGVHFFDMLTYVFGPASVNVVHLHDAHRAAGFLACGNASIRWFVSIDRADLPGSADGKTTFRSITVDGEEVEFSEGFADLHTRSYEEIIAGRGFGIEDARPSIEIVSALRSAKIDLHRGERHPFLAKHLTNLPMIPRKTTRRSHLPAEFGANDPATSNDPSVA